MADAVSAAAAFPESRPERTDQRLMVTRPIPRSLLSGHSQNVIWVETIDGTLLKDSNPNARKLFHLAVDGKLDEFKALLQESDLVVMVSEYLKSLNEAAGQLTVMIGDAEARATEALLRRAPDGVEPQGPRAINTLRNRLPPESDSLYYVITTSRDTVAARAIHSSEFPIPFQLKKELKSVRTEQMQAVKHLIDSGLAKPVQEKPR